MIDQSAKPNNDSQEYDSGKIQAWLLSQRVAMPVGLTRACMPTKLAKLRLSGRHLISQLIKSNAQTESARAPFISGVQSTDEVQLQQTPPATASSSASTSADSICSISTSDME